MKSEFILPRIRPLLSLNFLIAVVFLLTACGNANEPEPTPEPTTPPTPAEGQMTLADLVALSDDPWQDVSFLRTTSQSGPIPDDDDEAPAFTGSVQDWTPNGDRHVIEFQDGSIVNEYIWADGVAYMRGQFVSSAVAPELDVNTWVILDTEVVPDNTPVGIRLLFLTRSQPGPYGELSPDILSRPISEVGPVTVGDRDCTMYTFGDESNTGTEIRYEIAIEENGLPCQVIQRAGDFQDSTVYVYNLEETIEAPLEGTPVSGTPEG